MATEDRRAPASTHSQPSTGPHAIDDLVQAYDQLLVRVAYVICGETEAARDAAQETWVIALTKMPQLSHPAEVRKWLMTVVSNEARKWRRRSRRYGEILTTIGQGLSDGPAARVPDMDLAQALARLKGDERMLLALDYVAGMTSGDIGEVIGISPEGVRSRKARILARLRKELDDGPA